MLWPPACMTEHLNLFVNAVAMRPLDAEIMVEKDDKDKEKALEMTIEELDLSVRSFNCLKRAGINTVEDLVSKSRGRDDEGAQPRPQEPGRSHGESWTPWASS